MRSRGRSWQVLPQMGRAAARVWQKGKQPRRGGEEEKRRELIPPVPGTGAFRSLLNPY